jgi:hypothetical protein
MSALFIVESKGSLNNGKKPIVVKNGDVVDLNEVRYGMSEEIARNVANAQRPA